MAQKQGGKGKSSSPSSIAYWKRVSPTAQKTKRAAQHARRMGKSLPELQKAGAFSLPEFPKLRTEDAARFPIPMASLRELPNVALLGGGFVIADGRILDAATRTDALHGAYGNSRAVPRRIVRITPLGLSTVEETLR